MSKREIRGPRPSTIARIRRHLAELDTLELAPKSEPRPRRPRARTFDEHLETSARLRRADIAITIWIGPRGGVTTTWWARSRKEDLARMAESRIIDVVRALLAEQPVWLKTATRCAYCGGRLRRGYRVETERGTRYVHVGCRAKWEEEA